jgi:hypothetical protein
MSHLRRLFFTVLVSLLFLIGGCGSVLGQSGKAYEDGPYVVWHDSVRATVFYICQGELVSQEYLVADTLRFTSLCGNDTSTYLVSNTAPTVEPDRFDQVPRILAVSDIHGEYEAFVDFLQKAGAINSDRHWSYGDGHLVVNGDIVDRGDRVTEALWLVYRLEREAKQAGGRVHFTLGNHEKMVMRGDNRYVNEKYLEGTAKKSRILHQDLFGPDSELGRWLRTKHTMIRLNDILFVHAGISPELVERGWDMETVNSKVREYLDWSSAQVAFSEEPRFLLGSRGPLWYRGFFKPDENEWVQLSETEIKEILRYYGVSAIAVGHTLNDSVDSYYSGAVFGVGVPVEGAGTLQGLLWEDGHFYRVTPAGERELLK